MEGRTLLPITTAPHANVNPDPSCQDRDAVSPSSCKQIDTGACIVQSLSSGVCQNSAQLKPCQSTSSRNEDTVPAIIQCEASNSLSEERKENALKEMFLDLNDEKVKQALEFANSDLRLAINKVIEDTGNHLLTIFFYLSQPLLLITLYMLCEILLYLIVHCTYKTYVIG